MNKNIFSIVAAALVLLFITSCNTTTSPKEKNLPNILLVLSDDQSVPHVGCYGNPDIKTPNLDKFASDGVRFNYMHVSSPQCVPARASIFTGKSAVKAGMSRFSAPLAKEQITFMELLSEAGYFTGLAGRIYHMDGHNVMRSDFMADVFEKYELETFPSRVDYCNIADGGVGHIDQFEEFLGLIPEGRPWFCQLCFDDPHRPLSENAIAEPHDPMAISLPPQYPDTKLVREDFAKYYDEISRFDADFGRVMKIMEERGLKDNTLIIFMGDNGGAVLRGKGTLYRFGLNVPMLANWSGVSPPNTTCDAMISSEDLSATFLDIAGVEQNEDMDGKSFLPALKGEPFAGRDRVFGARLTHGYGLPETFAEFDLSRCVFDKEYKLIYNPLWRIPYAPADMYSLDVWKDLVERNENGQLDETMSRIYFSDPRPMFELYNLKEDPWELVNLTGEEAYAEIEQELMEQLTEWMIFQNDFVPLPIPF